MNKEIQVCSWMYSH